MAKNPIVLVILDGFGIAYEKEGNAIYSAKTPNFKSISEEYPGVLLRASGNEVGLSWGEMGNSEVGHLNLGSGLVVYQNLPRINLTIQDKTFFNLPVWKKAAEHAKENKSDIHLMGVVSNGGVHGHINHLLALLKTFKDLKFKGNVFIHFFADGRDASPQSAVVFMSILKDEINKLKIGQVVSVVGRYYSMDRNENWDRTKKAYDCLVLGEGKRAENLEEAIAESYTNDVNDEFIEPIVAGDKKNEPIGRIKSGDAVIFFNFRPDRARQLTQAFIMPEFKKFERHHVNNLFFVTMTDYGLEYPVEVAFPPQYITNPLAKVVADAGKKQLHIAETEKYAHVTYFFNGGTEAPFSGEDRVLIPSKDVKSFDEKPEMSAYEITERLTAEIAKGNYDFIVANFANGDMVGHTGNFKASVKAVEVLDECIGDIKKAVLKAGGTLLITADHGNVEELINLATGNIDKEHSTHPVPLWIIGPDNKKTEKIERPGPIEPGGILADVAPTVLEIMGLEKPKEMTGASLLHIINDCPLPKD